MQLVVSLKRILKITQTLSFMLVRNSYNPVTCKRRLRLLWQSSPAAGDELMCWKTYWNIPTYKAGKQSVKSIKPHPHISARLHKNELRFNLERKCMVSHGYFVGDNGLEVSQYTTGYITFCCVVSSIVWINNFIKHREVLLSSTKKPTVWIFVSISANMHYLIRQCYAWSEKNWPWEELPKITCKAVY